MSVTLSNLTMSRVSAGSSGSTPAASDPYWSSVSLLTETTGTNTQNNNVFLDSSTNNFTVTRAGSTTQGSFTPFAVANSASYSIATNGASAYFNGTTDYLSVPSNAAFDFGTGDFTIECWAYRTAAGTGDRFLVSRGNGNNFLLRWSAAGNMQFFLNATLVHNYTYAFPVNTWVHIAVTRSGSTSKLFINGAGVSSVSNSTSVPTTANNVLIGGQSPQDYFAGYISSTRIVKGTAVYTANFTPSTTPLTAITNTSLLLNYTNAGIYDAAAENNMFTQGNAQVSTVEKKFGTTSMKFDGDDCLQSPNNAALQIMGGDCTIETWFYPTAFPPTVYGGPIVGKTNASNGWLLRYSSSGALQWVHPGVNGWAFGPASLPLNAWYHVAIVKSGSTITGYVNGVQYPITSSTPSETTEPLWIATGNNLGYFTGYIQDMRITKGVARYTSNFTVPTEPFPTN